MVCLIPGANAAGLDKVLHEILTVVRSGYSCSLRVGIYDTDAVLHLTGAYSKALQALELASEGDSASSVIYYDPYDINFLLRGLDASAKSSYLYSLFGNTDPQQIGAFLDFAAIYLEENGALEHIAERLYIHKNTVKYKIHKLTELTGVDIRTCNGAYVFTVACMLGRRMHS